MKRHPLFTHFFLPFAVAGVLQAQPSLTASATVAPGKQSDIILAVNSPRTGDMIDILGNDLGLGVDIRVFLPDGREFTQEFVDQGEMTFGAISGAKMPKLYPTLQKALLAGAGDHMLLGINKPLMGGNFRIRINNRTALPTTVKAGLVPGAKFRLETLRNRPGAVMSNTIAVSPDTPAGTLSLTLNQSSDESLIDVASTRDGVEVHLRLPDGAVITEQNAGMNGMIWRQTRYPLPISGGDPLSAPLAATLSEIMLPVDGFHSLIQFPGGVRQGGTYTVEVHRQWAPAIADVSAIFVPVPKAIQNLDAGFQRLLSPPAK